MNSEHKSQNLQNIVEKYNIKKYECIDRCRYKIDQFITNINNIYGIDLSRKRILQVLNTTHSTRNMYFYTIT